MAKAVESEDGLPVPQRYWSILAVALAITMAVLDSAIANIALPTIARNLAVEPPDAIWIVNAYQLAIVVSLLPLASLGEIVGYARVYRVGLALFVAASLACALSHTLVTLTLARVAQGFGAAGIMAINGALVRHTYPAHLLGRGIGLNALIVACASAAGPTIASAILAVASWQWLFAVNVPIGIVALAIASFALPHNEPLPRRFDFVSAALNAAGFGLVIAGIDGMIRAAQPALGAVLFAVGATSFVALARRELRQVTPLLPLDLLRIPIFALSVATSICSFAAQMIAYVSLPFFFESQMGRSAVETGLLMTPWPISVAVVAPIAGRLADRMPAAILGGVGLAALTAGMAALSLLPSGASALDIVWRMSLCGLGFGFFQAPNNRTMMAAAPRRRSGAAGGMLATARLTGQTGGATLVAILLHLSPATGETLALLAGTALAAGGSIVSFARLASKTPDAAALSS